MLARHSTTAILDRGEYGWAQYVSPLDCGTIDQVARYYQRQGALLAVLHALGATDMHAGNLIAAGEHPVLVDLETLFHPLGAAGSPVYSESEPARDALLRSVIRTGLLPIRFWGNEDAPGIDVSGVGGAAGQVTQRAVPRWTSVATDEMRLEKVRVEVPARSNQPCLKGQAVGFLPYARDILAGFNKTYQLVADNRQHFSEKIVQLFSGNITRFLARHTDLYQRLLYDGLRPELLRDNDARERHVDRIWIGIEKQPHLGQIVSAERHDLLRGDVPFFATTTDSRSLMTSTGKVVDGFFETTGLSEATARISNLNEEDRVRQEWIIRATFASMTKDTSHVPVGDTAISPGQGTRLSASILIDAACAIGDDLDRAAIWENGCVGWLSFAQHNHREWAVQTAGLDLYSGLPGILLFLSALGAASGERRYRNLAVGACVNLNALVRRYRSSVFASIGAFNGIAGVIYALSHVGVLWQDPSHVTIALELALELSARVDAVKSFDWMEGTAGCVSSLLSLYAVTGSEKVRKTAVLVGDHLLAGGRSQGVGIGWVNPGEELALAGIAHGVAGIALALLRLASVSGEERFHRAALDALVYERSLFVRSQQNWLDLRRVRRTAELAPSANEQCFTSTWCNGATGIAMARLAGLPYLNDGLVRSEIDAAIEVIIARGVPENCTACHGTAADAETLAIFRDAEALGFGREGETHRFEKELAMRASALISFSRRMYENASANEVQPPGLMNGSAGVGYALLRLARPAVVPSILALEPPLLTGRHRDVNVTTNFGEELSG